MELKGIDADAVGDIQEGSNRFIYENADLGDEWWELRDNASGSSRCDIARAAGEENETERVGASVNSCAGVIEICESTDLNANGHGG